MWLLGNENKIVLGHKAVSDEVRLDPTEAIWNSCAQVQGDAPKSRPCLGQFLRL